MRKNLIIGKDFAEIKEVKGLENSNENAIRIYCNMFPNVFTFQIRTYKPITDSGNGTPRNMMASVSLDIDEVKKILKYMEAEKDRDSE